MQVQQDPAAPQNKQKQKNILLKLLPYLALVILYALIILYAVFSQSLYSTIAVLFFILSLIFNIASPAYLSLKRQSDKPNNWTKVNFYPTDKVLWIVFIVINIAFFIFKTTIYYTDISSDWDPPLQQFLEVGSPLGVFLPLVLIPFAALTLLRKPKSILLKEYSQRLNPYLALPLYLVLGILILLIQMLSVSAAGLVYFGIAFYLYWMKSFNFQDIQFKVLLYTVQILTTIILTLSYFVTITQFQDDTSNEYFDFFGINSINNFTSSSVDQGHIICEGLLSLLTAYLNRLFIYQTFNLMCSPQEIDKEDILKFQKTISIKSKERSAQASRVHVNLQRAQSQMKNRRSGKVYTLSKQVQMKEIKRLSVQSDPQSIHPHHDNLEKQHQLQDQKMLYDVLKLEEREDEELDQHSKKKKKNMIGQTSKTLNQARKGFIKGVYTVFVFLNSPSFSLRVIELLSIIVIQRFNNIYSFVALLWLAIVSNTQNKKVILIITGFAMLPMEFVNFIITYLFNIPYSPITNVTNASIFGFQFSSQMWLDILIFNIYFNYIILYLRSYSQLSQLNSRVSKPFDSKPAVWELVVAFCFRYSYLLTLIAMFFLGFSNPNLLNILLVALFLIFFSKGDSLIINKRMRNGKEITSLTTFSKKYWFIIVYYTLICILLKYGYFLFFPGDLVNQLLPTGINEVYYWSFNFSLSSVCLSNTSPWFIIFILAQIQIIIYRSDIYTSVSFSIMSYISQDTVAKPVTPAEKHKKNFIYLIIACFEIYYQSLYYISGIIIVGCSYRWSFISLAIIFFTIIGLFRSFSKRLLGIILFLNLGFLFVGYNIILINNYTAITNVLTKPVLDVINQIALFIGFQIDSSSYASLFILNVVIFYFCVLCYSLASILQSPVKHESISEYPLEDSPKRSMLKQSFLRDRDDYSPKRSILKQNLMRNGDDYHSMTQRSVLDTEFEDQKFAQNYKTGVILQIQNHYKQNLIKKYTWIRNCGKFFVLFWTDIVAIFVILQCLFFRLSISMFLFLIVYMVFYFVLFDQLGSLFETSGYFASIKAQLAGYANKQNLLEEETQFKSMVSDREALIKAQSEMLETEQNSRLLKNSFKKKIWKFSALLSATCLLLTYASQFITSPFYIQYVNFEYTQQLQVGLYIIGISVNPNQGLALYIYFYYVMLIINVIEKLILIYMERMDMIAAEDRGIIVKKTIRELPNLENPTYLINTHVSQPFIEELQQIKQLEPISGSEMYLLSPVQDQMSNEYYQQANMLIYFQYKHILVKINFIYGFISFIIRFYLWLMLLNVYQKSNIFAFAYLLAVLIFWFQSLSFSLIRNINKAAIIILCLQYLVLLLDINSVTSPLPLPYNQNLSLLQYLIDNPQVVNFIAVSSQQQDPNNNSFLTSFIVNSIIIFLTEVCFTVFTILSELMMKNIFQVYLKYQNILQKLSDISIDDPIIINYDQYKHFSHRVVSFLYQSILMSSYLFVSLLIFILLAGVNGYLALVLLVIAFLYIYLGIFSKISESQSIFTYTRYYFRCFNILQFICLIITNVLNIPIIEQNSDIYNAAQQFGALTSLQQIFLMLFIQLWLDLNASEYFTQTTSIYRAQAQRRQKIFLRSLAFQRSNFLIGSLIRQYKEVLSFDNSIAEAIKIIKQWHSSTNREMKIVQYDFEFGRTNKFTEQIQKQIQEQKLADDHKKFSMIMSTYVRQYTDVSLLYNYIQIIRYIVSNINAIIFNGDIQLSCWSFIKEDYCFIEDILTAYEERFANIISEIGEADQDQSMGITLLNIKNNFIGEDQNNQMINIKLLTPPKLVIDVQPKPDQEKISRYIIPFLLSNIQTLIILLIIIYYTLNPCLLSLPIIAFLFSYYIIATRKHVYLVVIYIFALILLSQLLQMLSPNINIVKFFFDTNTNTDPGEVYYNLPYLYFLFVVIFISQEVIRYKGNRYTSQVEVENLQQALLRVLMNEPTISKLNIWKYNQEQKEVAQNFNPFNVATYQIENHIQRLITTESFFDDVFSDRKIGIDLYPPIAAVQIFLVIYLIFFYSLMTDASGYSLEDSTKFYQFSSDSVIAVLVHVVNTIIQRKITILVLPRKQKLIIKYVYTMIILALFFWFIYYLAPFYNLLTTTATVYNPTPALIAFAFFYFIYFYLSALQIKYGYKEFKSLNSMMTRRGYVNYFAVTVYTAIPFLYQLKIIIDWTFTATNLALFDWFRHFSIYLRAFYAKIQYYSATSYTLGQPQAWYTKIIGWLGFTIIIIIIFGPMILFSGLNPIAQSNLVTSGSLSVALQVVNGNSFTLYSTSHFSSPPQTFTEETFDSEGFINVPTLQQMTSTDIPEQFESVTYEPYSDSNWGIAPPNYLILLELLNSTINELETNDTSTYQFQLVATYQLNRQVTETIAVNSQFTYPATGSLSLQLLKQLFDTLTLCNATVFLPDFYISLIRLNTIGTTYKPRPIDFTNASGQPYLNNVTLNLFCQGSAVNSTNDVYWGLYINNQTIQGVQLFVFCDKYQNILGGYGFTALYTSIILVVAGFVRSMFDGNMPLIPYQMNPRPDKILQICEAIDTLRVRKQYREEYLMYYQLIDLIRSPQIMKYMSGSYPYLIDQARLEAQHAEKIKELEKDKTL